MLTPCNPCICSRTPCEQCMFGYRSDEDNHKSMKSLIEAVERGEKPLGYALVDKYKGAHSNWKEQMEDDCILSERYKTCGRCVHDGSGDHRISGSTCYLCKRNPTDNRIDWFEEVKEDERN